MWEGEKSGGRDGEEGKLGGSDEERGMDVWMGGEEGRRE